MEFWPAFQQECQLQDTSRKVLGIPHSLGKLPRKTESQKVLVYSLGIIYLWDARKATCPWIYPLKNDIPGKTRVRNI